MIQIDVMPGGLLWHRIPSSVGIYGGLSNKGYVLFVKSDHRWRQRKNSKPIDPFMGEESPSRKCGPRDE